MAVPFPKGIDLRNQKAINMADGTASTDGINIQQLNAAIRGLDWKPEVIAASTANVSLTAPGGSMDGVTLVNPTRVMLKDNTAPAENGIYVWTGAAITMTRALDADTGAKLSGATVTVQQGTVNADRVYRVTSDDPLVPGTTAVTWVQVGAASASYVGGNGLTLTGATFDVVPGTGLVVAADSISIDTSVVPRNFAADCLATTNPQTFAHGKGTADLDVSVYESGVKIMPDISIDATNITVDYGAAPSAAQYRVVAK